jgi:hypothetical protein
MTKAKTKGQKRRGRRREDGPRDQNDRLVRPSARPKAEAAMLAVVEARCRAAGIWPDNLTRAWGEPDHAFASRKAARDQMIRATYAYVGLPWMGCAAGRAIAGEPDVAELWGTITEIRTRREAYLRAIDARTQAGTLNLMVAPDRSPGAADLDAVAADIRTEEERAEAAIAAWERLEAIMGMIGPQVQRSVLEVVVLDSPPPVPQAKRTISREVEAWIAGADLPMLTALRDRIVAEIASRTHARIAFPVAATMRMIRASAEFWDTFGRAPDSVADAVRWAKADKAKAMGQRERA